MVYCGQMSFREAISTILLLLLNLQEILASTWYCENRDVQTISNSLEGTIITRSSSKNFYNDNTHCTWILKAEQADSAVSVKVVRSHLQWAPVGAICVGYDYIRIYDGTTKDDPEILNWCGEQNPRSFTSSGPNLRLDFITNDRNQYDYKGIEMEYHVFERSNATGSCPPGWFDNPSLPSGGNFCYSIKSHMETWTAGYKYCKYDQANLVSIVTEEEADFLTDWVTLSDDIKEDDKMWISLNDLEVDGQYKWIDGSTPAFYRWKDSEHEAEAYYNCVVMNKEGEWQEDFCNENDIQSVVKHKFICKKNKVGHTELFDIPSERLDKGGEKTAKPKHTVIMIAVLVSFLVIAVILVLVLVCLCRKRKAKKESPRRNSPTQEPVSDATRPFNHSRSSPTSSYSSRDTERPPATAPPTAYTGPLGHRDSQTIVMIVNAEPPPSYDESTRHQTVQSGL